MSRITPDGFSKVHFIPTAAVQTAVTVAELAAGDELTPFLTRAGIDIPEEGTDADSSDLSSARDKSVPATIGGQITGEFYRDDGTGGTTDDAWVALPRLTSGFLIVARFGGTGTDNAIIATDDYELYPVRVSQRSNNRIVGGEVLRFTSVFSLSGDPVDGTLVA